MKCIILEMRTLLEFCLFILVLLIGTQSIGQEMETLPTEEPAKAIFIGDRSHADESSFVFEGVSTHLGDFRTDIKIHWLDNLPPDLEDQIEAATNVLQETGAKAVIWCDFSSEQPNIYFFSPGVQGRSVAVRSIDTTDREVAAETFGIIVRAWMTTLLAGEVEKNAADLALQNAAVTTVPEQVVDSEDPIEQVKDTESSDGVPGGLIALEAAYVLSALSSDYLSTLGLSVGVGFRFLRYWQLLASYHIVEPIEANQADVKLTLRRHPFWLQGRFMYYSGRMAIGGALAFGVDYATEKHASEIAVGEESAETRISLAPVFVLSVCLASELRAFVHLGAEIFLSQGRYVVLTSYGDEEVLRPWRVQPIGFAGLSFEFL